MLSCAAYVMIYLHLSLKPFSNLIEEVREHLWYRHI